MEQYSVLAIRTGFARDVQSLKAKFQFSTSRLISSTVYRETTIHILDRVYVEKQCISMMEQLSAAEFKPFRNLWGAHSKNLKNIDSQMRRVLGTQLRICYGTLKNNDLHRRNLRFINFMRNWYDDFFYHFNDSSGGHRLFVAQCQVNVNI